MNTKTLKPTIKSGDYLTDGAGMFVKVMKAANGAKRYLFVRPDKDVEHCHFHVFVSRSLVMENLAPISEAEYNQGIQPALQFMADTFNMKWF